MPWSRSACCPRGRPGFCQNCCCGRAAQAAADAHTSLRIHTGANPELLARLRQRELDLVIGRFAEPAHMPGLSFEHLYADPLVLAVRPGHPLLAQDDPKADLLAGLRAFTVILP